MKERIFAALAVVLLVGAFGLGAFHIAETKRAEEASKNWTLGFEAGRAQGREQADQATTEEYYRQQHIGWRVGFNNGIQASVSPEEYARYLKRLEIESAAQEIEK